MALCHAWGVGSHRRPATRKGSPVIDTQSPLTSNLLNELSRDPNISGAGLVATVTLHHTVNKNGHRRLMVSFLIVNEHDTPVYRSGWAADPGMDNRDVLAGVNRHAVRHGFEMISEWTSSRADTWRATVKDHVPLQPGSYRAATASGAAGRPRWMAFE